MTHQEKTLFAFIQEQLDSLDEMEKRLTFVSPIDEHMDEFLNMWDTDEENSKKTGEPMKIPVSIYEQTDTWLETLKMIDARIVNFKCFLNGIEIWFDYQFIRFQLNIVEDGFHWTVRHKYKNFRFSKTTFLMILAVFDHLKEEQVHSNHIFELEKCEP